jgi:hypothetical protein
MVKTATYLIALVALAAAPASSIAGAAAVPPTRLLDVKPRQLADASWFGGTYPTAGGEHVSVFVSTTYPDPAGLAQQWVGFFAGLPHSDELSRVTVYVAPLDEVQQMCGSADAAGCYGDGELVMPGDTSAGIAPESIAAHEYGHHIAANRSNAPWRALDWGTKRWATVMGICDRVAAGTAFPGDERLDYSLNPGEAFAESYRMLVETNGTGVGSSWPIVDPSFRPSAEALAALREDVLHPWTGPTKATIRARFAAGARRWRTSITTPLDGDLRIRLDAKSSADDVTLVGQDGRRMLATSEWDGSGGKELDYRVCGARSLSVRVTRGAAAARFTLRISRP